MDELFPVAEAMQLLRLADVEGGDIKLTHMGKRFADAELNERKEIFSRALMSQVPLAAHIRKVLDERASHSRAQDPLPGRAGRPYGRGCGGRNAEDDCVAGPAFGELFSYDDDGCDVQPGKPDLINGLRMKDWRFAARGLRPITPYGVSRRVTAARSAATMVPLLQRAFDLQLARHGISISDLTRARPSPVPSALRAKGEAIWRNGSSARGICSGDMPMPVSRTVSSKAVRRRSDARRQCDRAAGRGELDGVGTED